MLVGTVAVVLRLVSLPDAVLIDGRLGEWKGAASVVLDGDDLVAGFDETPGPRDFEARVHVAIDNRGLWLSARVRDDVVVAPGSDADLDVLRADHLEVWLGFDDPGFPELAFENQFGEHVVTDRASCEEEAEDPDACVAWVAAQLEHREALARRFRQYLVVLPTGELFLRDPAGPSDEGLRLAAVIPVESASRVRRRGYDLELHVPTDLLPMSYQQPIAAVRAVVAAVDADAPGERARHVYATQPAADPHDPATWDALEIPTPLAWPEHSPVVRELAGNAAYRPGPELTSMLRFVNVALGYQYTPEAPSPEVVTVDVARPPVASLGDVDVLQVFDGEWTTALLAVRRTSGEVVSRATASCNVDPDTFPIGGDLHLRYLCETTESPLGTGACGSCPALDYDYLRLRSDGTLEQLRSGRVDSDPFLGEMDVERSSEGPGFSVRVLREDDGVSEPTATSFDVRWDGTAYIESRVDPPSEEEP